MTSLAVRHQESTRFDFVESLRRFNYQQLVAPLLADAGLRAKAAGVTPSSKDDVAPLYQEDPHYLFACAIQRSAQRMGWSAAAACVAADRERLSALLDEATDQPSPDLQLAGGAGLPSWYTEHSRSGLDDIHLVPGGYWGDELVGMVYDLGGAVYRLAWREGYDARPGALDAFVRETPLPVSSARVLDLGCSFGGLTRVLRRALPDAEVIGIDLSAPALRYAHMLARRNGEAITYAQRDATDTGYESSSFDLVTAFLLLHEVPGEVRQDILAEVFRLLRPGGRLAVLDIPPYGALEPAEAFFESFDGRGNGENYWEDFLASDLPGALRSIGFDEVSEGPLDFEDERYWGSSALWRTGEARAVHRWVTRARRPAGAS